VDESHVTQQKESKLMTVRRVTAVVLAGLVLSVHWSRASVPTIDADAFDRYAVELTRSTSRRYGYARHHHGAVLVKADLVTGTPVPGPRPGDEIAPPMAHELRWKTPKALLELTYYALIAVAWRYRRRWIGPWAERGWRRCAASALRAAAIVTIVLLPYVAIGYGEPLLSTWEGPGGLSWSGPVSPTGVIERPVSYGLLAGNVVLWPMMATDSIAEPLADWFGLRGSLWFASVILWSAIAAAMRAGLGR
jgi:hypothetical protein